MFNEEPQSKLKRASSGCWLTLVWRDIKKIHFDVDKEEPIQDTARVEPILTKYMKKLRAGELSITQPWVTRYEKKLVVVHEP